MPHRNKIKKIVIAGANAVGVDTARGAARLQLAPSIVLLDPNEDHVRHAVADIENTLAADGLLSPMVASNTWHHASGADIVVITAGRRFVAGESTWDDVLAADPQEIERIAFEIKSHVRKAVVIVAADPGEVLVPLVQRVTEFPTRGVLGIQGELDRARLRSQIAREAGVAPARVSAHVFGGQGDAMVAPLSLARIDGVPLGAIVPPGTTDGMPLFKRVEIDAIVDRARQAGAELAGLAGATEIHPAHVAVRLVDAVARNRREILSCTAIFEGQYRTAVGACIALPVEVGTSGHWGVFPVDLTDREKDELERASVLVADRARGSRPGA